MLAFSFGFLLNLNFSVFFIFGSLNLAGRAVNLDFALFQVLNLVLGIGVLDYLPNQNGFIVAPARD
jgi:hypothetical protein